MDAIENGTTSLRKASTHWNILLISLSNHLYKKQDLRNLSQRCANNKGISRCSAWVLAM